MPNKVDTTWGLAHGMQAGHMPRPHATMCFQLPREHACQAVILNAFAKLLNSESDHDQGGRAGSEQLCQHTDIPRKYATRSQANCWDHRQLAWRSHGPALTGHSCNHSEWFDVRTDQQRRMHLPAPTSLRLGPPAAAKPATRSLICICHMCGTYEALASSRLRPSAPHMTADYVCCVPCHLAVTPPGFYTAGGVTQQCPAGSYQADWKPLSEAGNCTWCGDRVLADTTGQITMYELVTGSPIVLFVTTSAEDCCECLLVGGGGERTWTGLRESCRLLLVSPFKMLAQCT
jgi:hypothetical protein